MKEKSIGSVTFLLFVLLVCSSAFRLLPQKQGENEVASKGIIRPALVTDTKEDISNLMGSEDCNEKDEECIRRRAIAEAHLDYIYTQHHKP
ncbi:putative D-mannose binding lectin protein with Apple-like carbohydrate-binding domain [Hibiscus syriacus]|uniref:Phytosulfokine n=1 Tax=Hibiscus syriacus TaxID=106335 RepID=A0A6A3BK49_HIBSY|nr:putative phytosulfokines 6 [Hibiscus syriacus]XP_039068293.1 putative phytosulfokines 6 [Hibiscus syriacus]XP_039068294.1 putative phytosulfokines 6 [Hibiscus syriacus]KAE8717044.1 putative D-mannose binding lectin protein with Apple-like carbohydrate-binding domain [Hibiscus syriacus]